MDPLPTLLVLAAVMAVAAALRWLTGAAMRAFRTFVRGFWPH